MSNELQKSESAIDPKIVEQVLLKGDLSRLTDIQRLSYYKSLCHSLNLNPLTKPFEYLSLQGKTVLYATKACAEQLRVRDGISIEDVRVETNDEFVRVTAKAKNREGRTDVALAVVSIIGLKGMDRANAEMKCDTKAKRRVTLSICGLGMLDETEVETIPGAQKVRAEDVYDGTAEPDHYTIPFGKYKDMTLQEVGEAQLKSYLNYLFDSANKKGKEIEGVVREFVEMAQSFLETGYLDEQFKNTVKQ